MTASVWFLTGYKLAPSGRNVSHRFHPIGLEKFSCQFAGVEVEFDSLDVKKAAMGGFVLGGVNVLEIKNLRLTINEVRKVARTANDHVGVAVEAPDAAFVDQMVGLKSMFAPNINVSGIRVNGIWVYRKNDSGVKKLWLQATQLRNFGKHLRLKEFATYESGERKILGDARLNINGGCFVEYGDNFSQTYKIFS